MPLNLYSKKFDVHIELHQKVDIFSVLYLWPFVVYEYILSVQLKKVGLE